MHNKNRHFYYYLFSLFLYLSLIGGFIINENSSGGAYNDYLANKEINESIRTESKVELQKKEDEIEKVSNNSSEFYNNQIEKFMDENELQFEVFETDADGELKPIFMVGKCPPPERELLRRSINSVVN